MTGDKWVDVIVNFGTTPPVCAEIDVSEAKDKGIRWMGDRVDFGFTDVTIKEPNGTIVSGPGKEFYAIKTGTTTNSGGITVGYLTIMDKNSDKNDHTYTVNYTNASGTALTFDPGIKNQN